MKQWWWSGNFITVRRTKQDLTEMRENEMESEREERNPELYWQILEKMNIFEAKCSGKLCLVIGIPVTTTKVSY